MTQRYSICIIEDEAAIALDIQHMLSEMGYDAGPIIHNGDKAIDYLSFNTPDLVLCDIRIKGTSDGIKVANTIRNKKKMPFIFLTSLADPETLERAKHALPYGYIVKPFNQKELMAAVMVAIHKFQQEVNALKITVNKINSLSNTPLTSKESEIVMLMVKGCTYQEITDQLEISDNTLKYHTKHVFAKFDVPNRAALMYLFLQHFTIS